jgi:hypothetical protein
MTSDERRAAIEAMFADDNRRGEPEDELSPSGRYRLRVQRYATPGGWGYSRGTVTRVQNGAEVCDIKRNLGGFHHSFVAKDNREWLIAGRSYMSQTIVDLDRERTYEPPGDAYDPAAFCWAQARLSHDGCTLAIDGCHWACPYEYRFYDFTDPATTGWPALPIVEASGESVTIDVEGDKAPLWLDDGTIACYETRRIEGGDVVVARTRVRREDTRMVVIERWVDEAERQRRDEIARADAIVDARRERLQVEDARYLQVARFVTEHDLPRDSVAGWKEHDGQDVVQFYFRRKEPRSSADLSWGVLRGPIIVRLYDASGRQRDVDHELSEEGMARALALVRRAFE